MEKRNNLQLTEDEKIKILTGEGPFSAVCLPQKKMRGIRMADGPFGVKTEKGASICFPNTCLMASSWDRELCYEIGRMIGVEMQRAKVDLLLAPAINIKRNPLAGRNFEYYSEDPYLTGILATEYINGIHSEGGMVCVKHFACNNQEALRWSQDSIIAEDTLRNLYLRAFEIVVSNCRVDSIMASYNKVNGVHACENSFLLKQILRDEWKYDGVIMSDWGAISNLVDSYNNGLDLEMPGNGENTISVIRDALATGEISQETIDEHANRLLKLASNLREETQSYDLAEPDEKLVRKLTAESFILLKNNGVLPLKKEEKLLIVGYGCKNPRIQGGGCAKLQTEILQTPYDEIKKYADSVTLVEDFSIAKLQAEKAGEYDKVIFFLTLPIEADSEAFDRTTLDFPQEQLQALTAISSYNKNIIAILQNGSPVDIGFETEVEAIIETYYAGSCVGGAVADVLYGAVTPSGKLAETFPVTYNDVPNKNYFGENPKIVYAEKEYVGYRYYTSFNVPTRYPFGYGLSYCNFTIDEIQIHQDGYNISVEFDLQNNSSSYDGKEVVQIYLETADKWIPRLQLIEFVTIPLKKGEKKHCVCNLTQAHFTRYIGGKKEAYEGRFSLCIAKSSEEILYRREVVFVQEKPLQIDKDTILKDLLFKDGYREITLRHIGTSINNWAFGTKNPTQSWENDVFLRSSLYNMPLRSFTYFSDGDFTITDLDYLIEELKKLSKNRVKIK